MSNDIDTAVDRSIRPLEGGELDRVTGGLLPEVKSALNLLSNILSNVSKTRSEISMTFARNARA